MPCGGNGSVAFNCDGCGDHRNGHRCVNSARHPFHLKQVINFSAFLGKLSIPLNHGASFQRFYWRLQFLLSYGVWPSLMCTKATPYNGN